MSNIYPYGSWPSPISAELLTAQTLRLSEPQAWGEDVFWLEARPAEKGRTALVQLMANGERTDLLPAPHSVRTRAHEYGGGAYLVTAERIFCTLDSDQRIYCIDRNTYSLTPLSPEASEGEFRYADFYWDEQRQRLICVREDHTNVDSSANPKVDECSEIIAIDLTGKIQVLATGADFYSNPRLNPAGDQLSYLCWNHPHMPWDGTECYCAKLNASGEAISRQLIAGGQQESVYQPQWSPAGELYFVSDRSNWWNIYRHTDAGAEIVCEMQAEFATPQWVFGMSTYGFLANGDIFCCYSQNGQWQLGLIDTRKKQLSPIHSELKDISGIYCHQQTAYLLGASATHASRLCCWQRQSPDQLQCLVASPDTGLRADDISQPKSLSFATRDGENAFGFYYAPKNQQVRAPDSSLPPLLVMCHGGPTGATETSLNLKIQFWTSRGFAVLDVNYRGSTGYGRQYRDRLKRNWGITDVIDVCSGAQYLAQQGLVDPHKMAIRGSSAGGYTVLAALTFSDTFKAGASLYGIGDLEALAKDTHKFEARYLDSLVGDYPAEQATYQARSPIHHIDQLNCPVIFLQGLKDKVVPPGQAEAMVDALTAKGIKTEYVTFADEGHGFRQAENIQRAIAAELAFYQDIFHMTAEYQGAV